MTATILMRAPFAPALDLPPPFRLVTLREAGDAFAHATASAAIQGAGTLVHVGRFDLAEFAVVLEPAEPLRTARRALYIGLHALGNALAALAPPEKPITFDWPDSIRVDGGLVGGVRLGWPNGAKEEEPPEWLVFGAMIRTVAAGDAEPGLRPLIAALDEEGFEDLGSGRVLEGFARHLMTALDTYEEMGFGDLAKHYLMHLAHQNRLRCDIDENGDLLVRQPGSHQAERHSLVSALASPSWFDPAKGGPRR